MVKAAGVDHLLLEIVNNIDNAEALRHALDPWGEYNLTKASVKVLINTKQSLPDRQFTSIEQIREAFKDLELFKRILNELRKPKSSHPTLLLPLRLETRFDKQDKILRIRVYPDHIFVHSHESGLTEAEYISAHTFQSASDDQKRDAWRALSSQYGQKRAAWLVKWAGEHDFNSNPPPFKTASWTQAARLSLLPNKFCVFTYRESEEEPTKHMFKPLRADSSLIAPPFSSITLRFSGNAKTVIAAGLNLICNPTGFTWVVTETTVIGADGKVDVIAKGGFLASAEITSDWTIEADVPGLLSVESLTASESKEGLFDDRSKWMHDFDAAVEDGFATIISLTNDDLKYGFDRIIFDRVVVVGLKHTTASEGAALLEEQLDSHHYSKGLGFVAAGTTTNNTEENKSPYSEQEQHDLAYDIEISGAENWQEESDGDRRTNAHRLGDALGINAEHLRFIEGSGHVGDSYAGDMNTLTWPVTGDYYLNQLLPDTLTEQQREYVNKHVCEYVRGGGPLPCIRIQKQPYGILPVTRVANAEESNKGWGWAPWYGDGNSSPTQDNALHKIVFQFYQRWLDYTKDTWRVPHITKPDPDPDKTLLNILSMEPHSVTYRARPFVDEGFIAALLAILRNYAFGPDTPYEATGLSPLQWMSKWSDSWTKVQGKTADLLAALSGKNPVSFLEQPLLKMLAWWNGKDEPWPLVTDPEDKSMRPNIYLGQMCAGASSNVGTLLAKVIRRTLLLTKDTTQETVVRKALCRLSATTSLGFFNSVEKPEQIVNHIEDDPDRDAFRDDEPPLAYGVRSSLAQHILDRREELGGQFQSLDDIYAIKGVGPDTFHDILYTFRDVTEQPDLDRLFRESLDIASHRVDAWVTSFASKRLAGIRADEASQKGIHLGAYGFVEDLKPRDDPQSEGYLHTPSTNHAAAAAVLYNAFLTHDPQATNDPDEEPRTENPFHINLSSDRVRHAARILEGIRQGQSLAALLGYQFERTLKDHGLEKYIDNFREIFPIVAHKLTDQIEHETAEAVAARNVVDGLALVRDVRKEQGEESLVDSLFAVLNLELLQRLNLKHLIGTVADKLDAVSDSLLFESVYQTVQGNYDRAGAALEASSGNLPPPELTSVTTPVPGRMLNHRLALIFNNTIAEPDNNTEYPKGAAEPRLAAWLNSVLDLSKVGIHFEFWEEEIDPVKLKLANINTAPYDQLEPLPVIGDRLANKIIEEREQIDNPYKSVTDLVQIKGIGSTKVTELLQLVTTGFKQRININTAGKKELAHLFSDTLLEEIIKKRAQKKFNRIKDLSDISGIGEAKVEQIRPFVTTGLEVFGLDELGLNELKLSATDFLYIAQAPIEGEDTELEQRIARFVREEFALPFSQRIEIHANLCGDYEHNLESAIELAQQTLTMLAKGQAISPDSLCHPGEIVEEGYQQADVHKLQERVFEIGKWLCNEDLINDQTAPPGILDEFNAFTIRTTIQLRFTGRPNTLVMTANDTVKHNPTDTLWSIRSDVILDETGNMDIVVTSTDVPTEAVDISTEWSVEFRGMIPQSPFTIQSISRSHFIQLNELISLLEKASKFGVDNAFPPAADEPQLISRYTNTKAELIRRRNTYTKLINQLEQNNDSGNTENNNDTVEKRKHKVKKLLEATKIIFGKSYICLPTFTAKHKENETNNLHRAFHKQDILKGLGEQRLYLWMQQVAEVREAVASLEDTLMMTEAWTQSTCQGKDPVLALSVAQLPYTEGRNWLGLSEKEGAEVEPKPGWTRSPMSIVAAMHGTIPDENTTLAGLVIDSWEETIPDKQVNTSVAFQYDAPNTQPPQSLLLAVHPQMSKKNIEWTEDELAAIVKDTMDLAKVRAVDIDALAADPNQSQKDKAEPVGGIMPGIYLPTDPDKAGAVGKIVTNTIDEWIETLTEKPFQSPCADLFGFIEGDGLGPLFDSLGFKIESLGSSAPIVNLFGNIIFFPPEGIRITWNPGVKGGFIFKIGLSAGLPSMAPQVPEVKAFDTAGNVVASGFNHSVGFYHNYYFLVDIELAIRVEITGGANAAGEQSYSIHSMCVTGVT